MAAETALDGGVLLTCCAFWVGEWEGTSSMHVSSLHSTLVWCHAVVPCLQEMKRLIVNAEAPSQKKLYESYGPDLKTCVRLLEYMVQAGLGKLVTLQVSQEMLQEQKKVGTALEAAGLSASKGRCPEASTLSMVGTAGDVGSLHAGSMCNQCCQYTQSVVNTPNAHVCLMGLDSREPLLAVSTYEDILPSCLTVLLGCTALSDRWSCCLHRST
jgi:hypothetical protein